LTKQTRILLVTAGDTFLFEGGLGSNIPNTSEETSEGTPEVRQEDRSMEDETITATSEQVLPEAVVEAKSSPAKSSSASSADESTELELSFFRAKPKNGVLARKMGRVAVLRTSFTTTDGLSQAMEFVGVHQRCYCMEEPAGDAISANLVESLLLVALEFIFHPTRTRYTKERLVVRECSASIEAKQCGELLLPMMLKRVQAMNQKIKKVDIELDSPRQHRCWKRVTSFLVFDEDLLKVAVPKQKESQQPSTIGNSSASSSFGFRRNFLNTNAAKKHGLMKPKQGEPCQVTEMEVASSANFGSGNPSSACGSIADSIKPGERTRINTSPTSSSPPPVQTTSADRSRLLLPAANVEIPMTEDVRAFVHQTAEGGYTAADTGDAASTAVSDGEGETTETQGVHPFDFLLEEEPHDASTETPKSSLGEVVSEPSEAIEDHVKSIDTSHTTFAGIRGLQQHCRQHADNSSEEPHNSVASSTDSRGGAECKAGNKGAENDQSIEAKCDDLVQLWMKQRW